MAENKSQVIKLYKIISKDETYNFNKTFIEKLLYELNTFALSVTQKEINYIEINYNSRNWKSLPDFLKYLKSSKDNREIVYVNIFNELIQITYSNDLLNQIKPNFLGYIELILVVAKDCFSKKSLIKLIESINNLLSVDYGYSFELQKNQDVLTEVIEEKNIIRKIFANQTKKMIENKERWNERNLKLLEVRNGIIPQVYQFNIWNNTQKRNRKDKLNNEKVIEINPDLILFQIE